MMEDETRGPAGTGPPESLGNQPVSTREDQKVADGSLPQFVDEDCWTDSALAVALVRSGRTWAFRFWRALMLSPTIGICEALMRGEEVPLGKLDPYWVERFGLRGGVDE